ncbi:MAG TPA: hypothetical protein VLL82_04965 [Mycobacterium sp.]|nr:hypothetical protein [Mycobacterium sp.]
MPFANRMAQGTKNAVVGDERGQCAVGAFDHPGVSEVGQLRAAASDIADEGPQRVG